MPQKLTKKFVDSANPLEKDSFYWDSELKGFGLKVTPKGKKNYIVQYRPRGRATKRYTIGAHGSPWTPDMARQEAFRVLADVSRGLDPSAERAKSKEELTVAKLCDKYLVEATRSKKPRTVQMDKGRIEGHVKPLLGRLPVGSVTKLDIEKFMSDVASGKSAKRKATTEKGYRTPQGGEGTANRTLGMLGSVFEFAIDLGLRESNPVRGVKKFKEKKLTRFLSNEELSRLGGALREAESEGVNAFAIAAIRLLLLTGCRKNEILTLKWDEVDISQGFLYLSDSKTGARQVPIGAPARSILSELPRIEGNPHVICGEGAGHYVALQKVWSGIRAKAGLQDVRLHDLRHSFASMGARSGESLLVIGKVLGHATTNATGRYAHLSDDPVLSSAENTASLIQKHLQPKVS